ncbi:MAG: pilus assembly PilX N-terminal domain-containing protein [Candidatus Saccharibacteria bacterium]|nr:pilus assembly PilX N-terminal domain-containing protein [Candidatus Saccharibacteria bacterium]
MKYRNLHKDQSGIAAIMVSLVIMAVVTMIVLAFSQLVRREQRQAFDRQLNTQAYYAAESAINRIYDVLYNNPGAVDGSYKDNECTTPVSPPPTDLGVVLDAAAKVEATCIKIDDSVPELNYNPVDGSPKVVPIRTEGNVNITSMTFEWKDAGGAVACGNAPVAMTLPSSSAGWHCAAGMLRVDVVPLDDLTRNGLQNDVFTAFLYPTNNAGGATTTNVGSATGANLGSKIMTRCNGANGCTMTITGLSPTPAYAVRFRTIYGSSDLTITVNGGAANIIGAQAIIDVTGKAQDVLRRIQVRVPLTQAASDAPAYALFGGDGICKRYGISEREVGIFPDVVFVDNSGITDPNNACAIN